MMKKIISLISVLVLGSILSVSAMAKSKSHTLTFGKDFMVGEKLLEKGTYKFVYNKQAKELEVFKRGSKIAVAETKVRLEERSGNRTNFKYDLVERDGNDILQSIAFPRDRYKIVVDENSN